MNQLWSYFWPLFAIGLVAGAGLRTFGYRRGHARRSLLLGVLVSLGAAVLWHSYAAGPFIASAERTARQALEYYEMTQVDARLQRGPVTRDLLLAGRADDWQRGELARVLSQVPGVGKARWSRNPLGIPMLAEALAVALAGFLLGLLLAYLLEWHRRHNAQWRW